MTLHLGDVPASSTLYIPFASYNSAGASVTLTGLAVTDLEIYKNGSVTQRASDAGYTLLDTDGIDFDALTGIHGFSVDLADNTDAGFYAVGSFYWVVVSAVTIDGQTVNFIAATFRIVAAEAVAGKPKVDVDAWLGTAAATPTIAGVPEVDVTHADGTAWNSGAIGANTLATNTITAAKIGSDAIGASELAADAVTEIANAVAAPSAATIADAVWDEDATAHQTQGTFGQAIGDPGADTDTLFGLVNTNLDATVSSRASQTSVDTIDDFLDTEIAAIKAKTDSLTFTTANRVDSQVFGVQSGAIDATAIAADAIGASELAASAVTEIQSGLATAAAITALNNLSAAQVNAEVLDVLNVDTFAEPGQGNPTASPTIRQMLHYLYKNWRNKKTQTATTFSLFADNASTVDHKSTVADDGTTATRGEIATGP